MLILFDVADGNSSVLTFFCKIPGCVTNVTDIFCKEEQIPTHTPFEDCTGTPPPNTVCQHDGRAFVSINADGECDFEGKHGYIETQKCTGIYFYRLKPLM